MPALTGLALLLALQSLGEVLSHGLALALPGPVIGIGLLMPLLRFEAVRRPVGACAEVLLGHLSLLFVPAGVGVVMHLPLVAAHGLGLAVALVGSTWIGMAVTALLLRRWLRREDSEEDTAQDAREAAGD